MLFLLLSIVCLVTSFNGEKVAQWYWDHKYKSERDAAINLLNQNLVIGTAAMDGSRPYERGDLISFHIRTQYKPFLVERYQPTLLEQGYVEHAGRSGQLVVYYNRRFPEKCVLSPTMEQAKRLAGRPKPARMPDDKVSRFISLWGKVMAAFLFAVAFYSFRKGI